MKKLIIISLLVFSASCSSKKESIDKSNELAKTNVANDPIGSFEVSFQIDKLAKDQYNLAVALDLDGGAYVISPYSKDDTYLPFSISIPENEYFVANNKLIEKPIAVEEFDSILKTPVKFIREDTSFEQSIRLVGQEDFEVSGLISFLLEPTCIPYDVAFTMVYHNGSMSIEKTNTAIAAVYYGK